MEMVLDQLQAVSDHNWIEGQDEKTLFVVLQGSDRDGYTTIVPTLSIITAQGATVEAALAATGDVFARVLQAHHYDIQSLPWKQIDTLPFNEKNAGIFSIPIYSPGFNEEEESAKNVETAKDLDPQKLLDLMQRMKTKRIAGERAERDAK
jgi:hypothetical protein